MLSTFRNFASMRRLVVYLFGLLSLLMGCTTAGERARMRAGLDSINVLNRTDQPFTMADVQPYVDYFDDHGTSNDQVLAHYLLGRAYYKHGEAPIALQCYHEAIDCADTTAQDCDYAQLARVFGQMAELFYYQGLYRQQLEFGKQSMKYAWLGKDTLTALMIYEQESFAYESLGLSDSSIFITEDVVAKYNQYGYVSDAAIALGGAVKPLLDKGEYQKAKQYMDVYESKSGLFDAQGKIAVGREVYYNFKGQYYLNTGRLDSAEFYFRKELHDGKDFNNQGAAALGLAKIYQKQHYNDSAVNYALYAYAMGDSMYAHKAIRTIKRMQSMYDYTRNQEIARKEKENAAKEKRKLYFCISLFLLVLTIAIYVIYGMREEKKKQRVLYLHNLEQLEQTQSEILQLRAHADEYEELLEEKEKQLAQQRDEMQIHRKKSLLGHSAIEKNIKESDIYQILLGKQYGQALSIAELRECRKIVIENLPEFNSLLLSSQYKLNAKDFNVCILFRLGFKSKEISNMLSITQGRVSQISSKILREVFEKEEGGAAELIALLHELY